MLKLLSLLWWGMIFGPSSWNMKKENSRKVTEKAGWYFRVLDHPKDGPTIDGATYGFRRFILSVPSINLSGRTSPLKRDLKWTFQKRRIYLDSRWLISETRDIRYCNAGRFRAIGNPLTRWKAHRGRARANMEGPTITMIQERKGILSMDSRCPSLESLHPRQDLTKDLDGDGLKEVIINRNQRSTRMLDKSKKFRNRRDLQFNLAEWHALTPFGRPEKSMAILPIFK